MQYITNNNSFYCRSFCLVGGRLSNSGGLLLLLKEERIEKVKTFGAEIQNILIKTIHCRINLMN